MGNSNSIPTMYIEMCPENNMISKYFDHSEFHPGDSGLDLFIPNKFTLSSRGKCRVNLHVHCQAYFLKNDMLSRMVRFFKKDIPEDHKIYTGYSLYPRSSISKTPLMFSNSVGVIDSGYTGNLQMALYNVSDTDFTVEAGDRLCQIAGPQYNPIKFVLVSRLRDTSRGNGGFGSTNHQVVPSASSGTLTPRVSIVSPQTV